jgi:hypothetical protein
MSSFLIKLNKLTDNKKKVFLIGILILFPIVLKDIFKQSYYNFQIFSFGSLDFWTGNNPYTSWNHLSVLGKHLDYFLYSPQFSILFTPFAILPSWLGVLCWYLFTYTLFYFSVFSLPEQFTFVKKKFILLYSFLLLLQTLFSEQFNPVVAALFLFSFSLLEKNKGFWAVFLILLSGFTKVYGIFQIGMLLFYPRLCKNLLYSVSLGIIFFLLPLVKIPLNELLDYYYSWIKIVTAHSSDILRFETIYRPLYFLWNPIKSFMGIISLGLLGFLYSIGLFKLKLFKESFPHRVQFLGILMVWAILFGLASEYNTYQIAVVGYALWFLFSPTRKIDKILLWINFILLEIIPVDILCPDKAATFLLDKLNLNTIILLITWLLMVYKTFNYNSASYHLSRDRSDL